MEFDSGNILTYSVSCLDDYYLILNADESLSCDRHQSSSHKYILKGAGLLQPNNCISLWEESDAVCVAESSYLLDTLNV